MPASLHIQDDNRTNFDWSDNLFYHLQCFSYKMIYIADCQLTIVWLEG